MKAVQILPADEEQVEYESRDAAKTQYRRCQE